MITDVVTNDKYLSIVRVLLTYSKIFNAYKSLKKKGNIPKYKLNRLYVNLAKPTLHLCHLIMRMITSS
jgi:hypothetical protein